MRENFTYGSVRALKVKEEITMSSTRQKTYFLISGLVFAIVAIVHLLRIINQSPVVVGTWAIPMAGSVIGLIVAGILSYCGFILMCKEKGI